jgi:hypothetical protein
LAVLKLPVTLFDNFLIMSLQVIEDARGKATGVFIPISQWNILKKQHKELEALEYAEPTKSQLLSELKEAVVELSLITKGKKKSRPLKALLDEL